MDSQSPPLSKEPSIFLHTSLLSVAQLADARVRTISDPQHIDLVDIHTRKAKDHAIKFHHLYKLEVEIIYPDVANVTQSHLPSKASLALCHCLSHISEDTILRMVQSEAITGMEVVGDRSESCSACHKGKQTWNMIPKATEERSSKVLG